MSAAVWQFAGLAAVAAVAWLALYRLPLARPRVRQRVRLAVASVTGLPPRYVFPVLGTLIYLATGLGAIAVVTLVGPAPLGQALSWQVSLPAVALTVLVVVGAAAATGFAMSLLYALRPGVDVPGAVAGTGWIREILVLPPAWRWLVPMSSAAVEEVFFRGVVLVGLLTHGASVPVAIVVSGALFVAGQVVLTERGLAAVVLGSSSIVLSALCGLLVVVTGSVVPAVIVHASFAGYYTNLPAAGPATGGAGGQQRVRSEHGR